MKWIPIKNEDRRRTSVTGGVNERRDSKISLSYYARPKIPQNNIERPEVVSLSKKIRHIFSVHKKKKVAALIATASLLLFFSTSFLSSTAISITTEGVRVRADEVYQNYINSEFHGWSRRSKLTLDTDAVEGILIEKFPEIYDASVYMPLFSNTLMVTVKIRPLVAMIQNDDSYLLIDTNGVIVAKTNALTDENMLFRIVDNYLPSTVIGDKVYSADTVMFFNDLQQIIHQKTKVVSMLQFTGVANMISLRFSDTPYEVLFDISSDAVGQYGAYEAVISNLEKQGIIPKQYIDVRLSEKVYYL